MVMLIINRIIRAKQFKLPLEETSLNRIYNLEGIVILDEKVFQDKPGDVVVYLKWEQFAEERDDLFD
jgi:hypothetical protein